MIRELWLEDNNGNKYSFNDQTTCFATELQNLGVETELTYFEYTNSYVTATTKMTMMKPTMNLHFIKGYQGYSDFLSFISKADELKLYYKNVDTKYCLVDIEKLAKTELATNISLTCQIVFNRKSLWMKEYAVSINIEQLGDYKTYDYTYDYRYIEVVDSEIFVENRGSIAAPVNFTIKGNLENPSVQILVNGEVVSECRLNITYDEATLTVNSEEGKEEMKVVTSEGEEINVYQDQDFTKDGFLFVPVGNSKVRVIPGGAGDYIYTIVFHELYRGN